MPRLTSSRITVHSGMGGVGAAANDSCLVDHQKLVALPLPLLPSSVSSITGMWAALSKAVERFLCICDAIPIAIGQDSTVASAVVHAGSIGLAAVRSRLRCSRFPAPPVFAHHVAVLQSTPGQSWAG